MKLLHIKDGPPLYTNCFLLIGDKGNAVAVDPAADARYFEKALQENDAKLTHILLTHGHHDHIGSVETLREKYGALLCMNKADAEHFELNADVFFVDGGEITVDDMSFRTIFTPGHTPGSTCIVCGGIMFTGDTLFAGTIGRTDLPGGDMDVMWESLKKIRTTVEGNPKVLPGHERFSTLDEEKEKNPYLKKA